MFLRKVSSKNHFVMKILGKNKALFGNDIYKTGAFSDSKFEALVLVIIASPGKRLIKNSPFSIVLLEKIKVFFVICYSFCNLTYKSSLKKALDPHAKHFSLVPDSLEIQIQNCVTKTDSRGKRFKTSL